MIKSKSPVLIIDAGIFEVEKNTNQARHVVNIFTSIMAWLAVILALVVLSFGDDILQEIESIYPDWAFPVFFIPWFLLVISSVQKLLNNQNQKRLSIWILKTTIPLFIFTTPFFSKFLSASTTSAVCTDNCAELTGSAFGFEPYCIYIALLSLFLLHIIPGNKLNNKLKLEAKNKH